MTPPWIALGWHATRESTRVLRGESYGLSWGNEGVVVCQEAVVRRCECTGNGVIPWWELNEMHTLTRLNLRV